MDIPNIDDIKAAHKRIKPFIHKTPVLTSTAINEMFHCRLYFKCENFQKVGAFKYRGATNAVQSLSKDEAQRGVATHSSGNHAQALALAAKVREIKATVVMPENAPQVKKDAVASYGADIIFCKPTLEAREGTLNQFVTQSSASIIHPYDNFNVIAGQGTAALEFLQELNNNLDYIICPVGGGGLLSGTAICTKAISSRTQVIAAEPHGANDAYRSFTMGKLMPSINPHTIADGLLTSLSERTFSIIKSNVDSIITVQDHSAIQAMKLIWERMKIIIEASSAFPLGILIENHNLFRNKNIGIILSGGNIDLNHIPWIKQ